jgi:hypothetical protein
MDFARNGRVNIKMIRNFVMVMPTKIQHFCMCTLRNIEFLVSPVCCKKLLDRALELRDIDTS